MTTVPAAYLTITRQPLELESCSSPIKVRKILAVSIFFKNWKVLDFRFSVSNWFSYVSRNLTSFGNVFALFFFHFIFMPLCAKHFLITKFQANILMKVHLVLWIKCNFAKNLNSTFGQKLITNTLSWWSKFEIKEVWGKLLKMLQLLYSLQGENLDAFQNSEHALCQSPDNKLIVLVWAKRHPLNHN